MDFTNQDITDTIVTPFDNETNKRYMYAEVDYWLGKQLTIQPDCAKADCQINIDICGNSNRLFQK